MTETPTYNKSYKWKDPIKDTNLEQKEYSSWYKINWGERERIMRFERFIPENDLRMTQAPLTPISLKSLHGVNIWKCFVQSNLSYKKHLIDCWKKWLSRAKVCICLRFHIPTFHKPVYIRQGMHPNLLSSKDWLMVPLPFLELQSC